MKFAAAATVAFAASANAFAPVQSGNVSYNICNLLEKIWGWIGEDMVSKIPCTKQIKIRSQQTYYVPYEN